MAIFQMMDGVRKLRKPIRGGKMINGKLMEKLEKFKCLS